MEKKRHWLSQTLIHTLFVAFCLTCIMPLLSVVTVSLTKESDILLYGFSLIPKQIDFSAYKYVLDTGYLFQAYLVSATVVLLGCIFGTAINAMVAYPLSRRDFRYRNFISFAIFFTMLFNGGLVPSYIMITQYLHLKDSIFVLILPYLANAWYILLLRTFMQTIPSSVIESAELDGASQSRIFISMIVPMSTTALGIVGLFTVLMYWNDWWLAMLYISRPNLVPLQYLLYRLMNNIDYLTQQASSGNVQVDLSKLPRESARMAMCVLAVGPMMFVFPFFSKYFVKGIMLGSVKG
jgi:putative aldouronate transport system permease protein